MAAKQQECDVQKRRTPWPSVFAAAFMLALTGVQMSIYFMSTWQYLREIDPSATIEFFGWIVAACSLGCAVANPLFGHWNQMTLSTTSPITFGFSICALGNLTYALLPLLSPNVKWFMLTARFLTGFGAGTLGVLRSYIATASTKEDRIRAVSLGTAGLTSGLSLGPAIQICFVALGSTGFSIGPVIFNMYTSAAFFMCAISIVSVILANTVFVEDYAGIISDDEKKEDPFLIIPKFDRIAVCLLFFMWWMMCGVASSGGLSAPVTMAMYDWTNEEAVLYNGIIQTISCAVSTLSYFIIGSTQFGQWDRRIHLFLGLAGFFFYHICHYPMPFYDGPLHQEKSVNGTVVPGGGGCPHEYDWCRNTPRVPKPLYLFNAAILLGLCFPLISAPCNTLLSEILGPRKQGTIQGFFAFFGSMAQFVVPILATKLFETTGYKYIVLYHLSMIVIGAVAAYALRKRLIPLQLTPTVGKATKFKRGTFYRM
ncbi:MFS domain-containing protein [Trichostrongylus colubriformis]|uniref:MFS domain-containing protein n=1 Tax=Trichostrongylus colubriformis TaxID=6319 RepID=A0AAN8FB66_TRICO